jgi:hypothetical protein
LSFVFSAFKERADTEYTNCKLIADQYQAIRDKAIEQMKRIGCNARNDPSRVLQDLEAVGTWGENLWEASYRVLDTFSLARPDMIDGLPTTLGRSTMRFSPVKIKEPTSESESLCVKTREIAARARSRPRT